MSCDSAHVTEYLLLCHDYTHIYIYIYMTHAQEETCLESIYIYIYMHCINRYIYIYIDTLYIV